MNVYGKYIVQITKTAVKRLCDFPAKNMKPLLLAFRKHREPQRSVTERAQKSSSIQKEWVYCFVTTQRVDRKSLHPHCRRK
jgi:hypothetical protein